MASTAFCAIGNSHKTSLGDMIGTGQLPRIYEEALDVSEVVNTFISNSVNLLFSGSVLIRESVKDALGNELPLSLGRTLVSSIMR